MKKFHLAINHVGYRLISDTSILISQRVLDPSFTENFINHESVMFVKMYMVVDYKHRVQYIKNTNLIVEGDNNGTICRK